MVKFNVKGYATICFEPEDSTKYEDDMAFAIDGGHGYGQSHSAYNEYLIEMYFSWNWFPISPLLEEFYNG